MGIQVYVGIYHLKRQSKNDKTIWTVISATVITDRFTGRPQGGWICRNVCAGRREHAINALNLKTAVGSRKSVQPLHAPSKF